MRRARLVHRAHTKTEGLELVLAFDGERFGLMLAIPLVIGERYQE